jgi:hypothetical protein
MESTGIQQHFFQHIKNKLPGHISMVDDVAELLGISNDSAYRRIRGEKQMSFEEIGKLSAHYKVSLDHFLNLPSDSFIFSGKLKNDSNDPFLDYLQNVQQNFQYFNSFEKKHMYILMKDIPPFVHFQIPELAKFKFYFWMKSILHYDALKSVKFDLEDTRYDPYIPLSKSIIDLYNRVPMTEIWNIESLNSTLRQINFYYEAGAYKHLSDIKCLYEKTAELIDHIERQAELGCKFNINQSPAPGAASYQMLVNELILGDNTYMAELGNARITFLNHSVLYFVATQDERFNKAAFDNMQNLIKRSTLVSTYGEKERSRFFGQLRVKIQQRLDLLN